MPFTSVVSAGVKVVGVLAGALYDAVDVVVGVEQVVDAEKLTHIFISPFDYLRVLHLYKNDIKRLISKGEIFVTLLNKLG